MAASVDKVTHKEVVGVGALASDFEELLQVEELTMDITTYLLESTEVGTYRNRTLDFNYVAVLL